MRRILRCARWSLAGAVVVAGGGLALSGAAISLGTPVVLPTSNGPAAIAVADVTGDGIGDVVVAGNYAANVVVRPGNGDGTFGAATVLPMSASQVTRIRTARLNGDAAVDFVVDHANTAQIDVFLSDGAGGFARTEYLDASPGDAGRAFALADWDRDGDVDIVTVATDGKVRVLPNVGAGVFGAVQSVTVTGSPLARAYGFAAADLDGDGDVDLAVTYANLTVVYWRKPDGSLEAPPAYLQDTVNWTQYNARTLTAADVDGDGLPDLVGSTPSYTAGGIMIYRHATPTTFLAAEVYAGTDYSVDHWDLAVADLNGDGRPEVLTAESLWVNAGDGTFAPPVALPAASPGSRGVAAGNFDADAHPDVVVVGADGAVAVPVVTSGPAPAPSVEMMSPGFLSLGATSDVEIYGAAFQTGVAADFGADVTVNSLVRVNATTLRANVTVATGVPTGARTAQVTNPDSGTTSFRYPVLAGGAATISQLTPALAHVGDTLQVLVEGTGFVAGATAQLGDGVAVTAVDVLGPTAVRLTVTVAPDAAVGTRDLTVVNGSGATTILPAAFRVLPPPSLDVTAEKGRLATTRRPHRARFVATGSFRFNERSPDATFAPATEGAEIRFGDPASPSVVTIGPDLGWHVRGGRVSWRSPRRTMPAVHLRLNLAAGTFRIDVARADIAAPAADDVLVELTLGGETGTSVRTWTPSRNRSVFTLR